MRVLLPLIIMIAGLGLLGLVLSWKWRGAPSVRRRIASVANGRKPRRFEGLPMDARLGQGAGYAGVLILFPDELVYAAMNGKPDARIPLAAIRDVTTIRSALA